MGKRKKKGDGGAAGPLIRPSDIEYPEHRETPEPSPEQVAVTNPETGTTGLISKTDLPLERSTGGRPMTNEELRAYTETHKPTTAGDIGREISGGIEAQSVGKLRGLGEAVGFPVDEAAPEFADLFGKKEAVRQHLAQLKEEHPFLSGYGDVAGQMGGGVAMNELLGGGGKSSAPSAFGRIARTAAGDSLRGGFENMVASSTSDINENALGDPALAGEKLYASPNMLKHFAVGVGVGGVLGTGLSALGEAASAVGRKAAPALEGGATRLVGRELGLSGAEGARVGARVREGFGGGIPKSPGEIADFFGREQAGFRGAAADARASTIADMEARHASEAAGLGGTYVDEQGVRRYTASDGVVLETERGAARHKNDRVVQEALDGVAERHQAARDALSTERGKAVESAAELEAEKLKNVEAQKSLATELDKVRGAELPRVSNVLDAVKPPGAPMGIDPDAGLRAGTERLNRPVSTFAAGPLDAADLAHVSAETGGDAAQIRKVYAASGVGHEATDAMLRDASDPLMAAIQSRASKNGLTSVPELAKSVGGDVKELHKELLRLYREGKIELRPESGMGRLSKEEMALSLPGPQGSRLTWIRQVEPELPVVQASEPRLQKAGLYPSVYRNAKVDVEPGAFRAGQAPLDVAGVLNPASRAGEKSVGAWTAGFAKLFPTGEVPFGKMSEVISSLEALSKSSRDPGTKRAFSEILGAARDEFDRASAATAGAHSDAVNLHAERLRSMAPDLDKAHANAVAEVQKHDKLLADFEKTAKGEMAEAVDRAAYARGDFDKAAAESADALRKSHKAEVKGLPKAEKSTVVDELLAKAKAAEAAAAERHTRYVSPHAALGSLFMLGHGNVLGAAAALGGSFLAGQARAAGNLGAARVLHGIADTLGTIDAAIRTGAARTVRGAAKEAANVAIRDTTDSSPKRYQRIVDRVRETQGNPQILEAHVRQQLGPMANDAPQIYASTLETAQRAQTFLESAIPPERRDELSPTAHLEPSDVSDAERYDYMQYVGVIRDPISALRSVADGTITEQEVVALREVYPGLYSQMKSEITRNMNELQKPVNYEAATHLGTLFEVPMSEVMQPDFQRDQAKMYAERAKSEEIKVGSQPKGPNARMSKSSMSGSQQIESGEGQ